MTDNLASCIVILLDACVAYGNMASVTYRHQCLIEMPNGVPKTSQSTVRCAQVCMEVSPRQCHGYMYKAILSVATATECQWVFASKMVSQVYT